jgi:hypothetical protein
MRVNARRLVSIAFALLLTAAYSLAANETDDLIKLVTKGASSDAERAAKLVESAGRMADNPAAQETFYNKAYELGVGQVNGVAAALKALDALATMEKADPAELQERRLKAYRLLYARGPAATRVQSATTLLDMLLAQAEAKVKAGRSAEAVPFYQEALQIAGALNRLDSARRIGEQMKDAAARSFQEKRAKDLQAGLDANPDDLRCRQEYLLICIVDLDDPARAKEAVNASVDEALRTYVPLAAQDPQAVAPQACLELARWYEDLGAKAGRRGGRLNTLGRAMAYYKRALEAGTLSTVEKLKAEQSLQQVEARLQVAGGGKPAINLLAMVQPGKDFVAGTWKADGQALTSDAASTARVMLPYQVPEEYDLHVEFTRHSGGTVCIIFCHAGREFVLETGWPGGQTGFAYVNGKHIDQNETGTRFPIINGRRHSFIVQVRKAGLRAIADGQEIIAWKTDYRNLTPHTGWVLPDKQCVGFGSHVSPTTLHLAELIEITGSGKKLH